ncbi:MAG: NAD-dependent epimerase/dehydratase family protein [Elusimicrobiales bacterium]|jgi:nucleoside-diphosphate-sugar epimerase
MKILILGGTSFFGRETAKLLSGNGNEVTVFSRRCPIDGLPPDITQIRGDRTVEIDLTRMAVGTWDAVIDNICYTAEDAQKAVRIFNGRTGLYIFTSSASVYSALQGASTPFREIQTELLPLRTDLKDKPYYNYAAGKYAAEKTFLDACGGKKFPAIIIRPPVVIGPGDPTLRAHSYWLRLSDDGPLIVPNPTVSARYIFSKDLARAFELLIGAKNIYGQAFNFGDSAVITLEDFVKISARILHKEPRILAPGHAWLKANGFNFAASPFSGASDFIVDISKAEKALGWRSTEMHAWLEETINWFFLKYTGPMPENYSLRKQELELARKWKASYGQAL